jgi:hypothetical protein
MRCDTMPDEVSPFSFCRSHRRGYLCNPCRHVRLLRATMFRPHILRVVRPSCGRPRTHAIPDKNSAGGGKSRDVGRPAQQTDRHGISPCLSVCSFFKLWTPSAVNRELRRYRQTFINTVSVVAARPN